MGGLGKAWSAWAIAPCAAALVVLAALAAGVPLYLLAGAAAVPAFLALVAHSPSAAIARTFAITAVGVAWLLAPFSGVTLVGGFTLPELMILPAALVCLLAPGHSMPAAEAVRSAPIGFLLLILIGGLIGSLSDGLNTGNLLYLGRLAVNGLLPLFMLRRIRPTERELTWLTLAWVGGAVLSAVAALAGMVSPSGRSVGFAGHPNQLAMMASMALPLVVVFATRKRLPPMSRVAWYRPPVVLGALGILVGAVVVSGARSGLLALAAVVLLVAYRYLGTPATAALCVLGVGAALLAGLPQQLAEGSSTSAFARFASDDLTSTSDAGRTELLTTHLAELRGLTAVVGAGFEIDGPRPHNIFLQVWGSAGIVGLVGLAGLIVPVIVCAVRRYRGKPDLLRHPVAVAAAIGFIGYLVALSFNNALELPYVWTFYALWERWHAVRE